MSDDHNDGEFVPDENLQAFLAGNPHAAALQLSLRPQDLLEVQSAFQVGPTDNGEGVRLSIAAPDVVLDALRSVAVAFAADPEKTTALLTKVSDLHDRVLLTEDDDERDIAEYAYHKAANKVAEHVGFTEQQGRANVSLDVSHLDALVMVLAGGSVALKHHLSHCSRHGEADTSDGD